MNNDLKTYKLKKKTDSLSKCNECNRNYIH